MILLDDKQYSNCCFTTMFFSILKKICNNIRLTAHNSVTSYSIHLLSIIHKKPLCVEARRLQYLSNYSDGISSCLKKKLCPVAFTPSVC